MRKKLVIIGASGQGKVVANIAQLNGYEDIVFLDDDLTKKSCLGFPIIGKIQNIMDYKSCDFFVAIGNSQVRKNLYEKYSFLKFVTLIHPSAVIGKEVKIGPGSVVMAGAIINEEVIIGKCCIINTHASIDHDCVIGDFVHVSVASHLAGNVIIGEGTWVGIGTVVSNNVTIVSDSFIGAGATVVNDIVVKGKYVGTPAKLMLK